VEQKYVALAVPFFFFLIGVEWLVLRARGRGDAYRFADSITNLSCGIGQQVLEPFFKVVMLAPYAWLWSRARLFDVSVRSVAAWLLLVPCVDLGFYAFHRASHRIGVFWAVHAVHHQSQEYNLSVALRQPWLQSLIAPFFYLPLALIGFPPVMVIGGVTLDTLYQFWVHTRTVRSLGPFEWVMNTPSHHRVHHGLDPEYLDRNYGGIFIVWDRLFGTFEPERREPTYGTVKPLATWNPLAANLRGWRDLASMSRETRRLPDKVRVWFAPPEWSPADLRVPHPGAPADETHATHQKSAPRYGAPAGVRAYVASQFAVATVAALFYLWFQAAVAPSLLGIAAVLFGATLVAWAGLLEGKRWGWPLEIARVVAAVVFVAALLDRRA
jgi:alkylglycerol monooxygenase